jgi:hypothetical protein
VTTLFASDKSQITANLEYYRSLDDERLMFFLKEVTDIWFTLLLTDVSPEVARTHNTVLEYWEHCRDLLELVAKERKLISDTTIS